VVLEAAVGVAARAGQGFVAFPRGLNTAEQMAERADVPAATLFRLLDDEDQRATVITRFLGRAEFAAAQEGAVIVAGRTRPDTVTALFSWALRRPQRGRGDRPGFGGAAAAGGRRLRASAVFRHRERRGRWGPTRPPKADLPEKQAENDIGSHP
jgi:hypothetical protein